MLPVSLRTISEHGTQHCKMMHETRYCCWQVFLFFLSILAIRIAFGLSAIKVHHRQPPCQPGKVPGVLAVRHGNIGIPCETKCILYLLFARIVILNFFKEYD